MLELRGKYNTTKVFTDNVDNYTLFIKSRFYPANVIIFTMTGCK